MRACDGRARARVSGVGVSIAAREGTLDGAAMDLRLVRHVELQLRVRWRNAGGLGGELLVWLGSGLWMADTRGGGYVGFHGRRGGSERLLETK